jgi:hypothetical protein
LSYTEFGSQGRQLFWIKKNPLWHTHDEPLQTAFAWQLGMQADPLKVVLFGHVWQVSLIRKNPILQAHIAPFQAELGPHVGTFGTFVQRPLDKIKPL